MNIIRRVLSRSEFEQFPPVLIDVGASGSLNPAWKQLARYSVCIAFDPDNREMATVERASEDYKRLYVFNRAVTDGVETTLELYLTQSPPCSSVLVPNSEKLSEWEFADRFVPLSKSRIEAIQLTAALRQVGVDQVDWFKTDSQGTDLRLFLSLGERLFSHVLVAEFEPGIIDAYVGEDKLWHVLRQMDEMGFWMSDINIKGSSRIRKEMLQFLTPLERKYMIHLLKISPGWAEVRYLNPMRLADFNLRDYLLACVCAVICGQYGFALQVASRGLALFADEQFAELEAYSVSRMRTAYLDPRPYLSLVPRIARKVRELGTSELLRSVTSGSA